jgi:hypothetical protein
MRPFTAIHLKALAEAYCAATGDSLHALGTRSMSQPKLFKRLVEGRGCTLGTAERASVWFMENWPDDVPWPDGVPAAPLLPTLNE